MPPLSKGGRCLPVANVHRTTEPTGETLSEAKAGGFFPTSQKAVLPMLSLLHIENIAVIESADISFGGGFNVLTGETGAGKSIVIDSLGAVLGERTSRDLIRTGAKKARVTAVFCALPALAAFEESGIGPDENGELILEREMTPEGKNICRAGGRPITVSQLKALGRQLLNIHGQHDGQQLLDERCHLDYLDRFGGDGKALEDYRTAYAHLRDVGRRLDSLQMDEGEKARRVDTLTYQINELERAALREGEEETLNQRRDLLRNAGRLMDAVETAWQALTGGDDGEGAVGLIDEAAGALASASRYSDELAKTAAKAEELRYAADDVAEQVRDLRDSFDFSPEELDQIEGRLDTLYRLKKKYGGSVEEMLAFLEKCRKELDDIEFSADRAAKLERELAQAKAAAVRAGQALSQVRRQAAEKLAKRVQEELTQLDMPKVRFEVEFSPKTCPDGLDETGPDEVRFLMSANVGEALKPINKIASGGELARIMLALKNVLAENDDVTTLVFDEVDTGVSGRAAQKVAQKLCQVARSKQVLCVTHLPQLAAMGDVHFRVRKGEDKGRTFTAVEELDRQGRKEELARLTGGEHITQTMLDGAGELLDAAEQFRASL